jgi:ketosteroid isomerase-like protein
VNVKEDIQKLFSILDSKDATGYGELLTDNSIFRFGNSDPAKGKQAIQEAQSGFFKLVKAMSHELVRTWKDSNSIVVEGKVTYTREDDTSITLPFVDIFEFDGDKIAATLIFMDINPLFQSSK